MKIRVSDATYSTFCSLVTGYRSLAVITQAIELGLIETVGLKPVSASELRTAVPLPENEGSRFVELLIQTGLLELHDGTVYLSAFSRKYLLRASPVNQLSALQFEKKMISSWSRLGTVLCQGQSASVHDKPQDEYHGRLELFQGAMHDAAVIRSQELWAAMAGLPDSGLIIDVGAGDGTYLREFISRYPDWKAIACDLPDVLELSRTAMEDAGITCHACNIADHDERSAFVEQHAGSCYLLLLSNLLHCYGAEENTAMLGALGPLLADGGLLLVHDFFRDGNGFGALYDIHMLVNTYNGRCYSFDETSRMLLDAGFCFTRTIELPSFSHVLAAARHELVAGQHDTIFRLRRKAHSLGFFESVAVNPCDIRIEPWVTAKCEYGCRYYGKKWSCPPHSMNGNGFRELLGCYSRALLVVGQPPLKQFQEQLLELEKAAFLDGSKKALVFSGGPCCWCDECPDDRCLFPEKRRPSLESCGCDVFDLARVCGLPLSPLRNDDDFIQYFGLLLVD